MTPIENLYIHYPYCLYKCHYCDFNSYAFNQSEIPGQDYLQALLTDLTRQSQNPDLKILPLKTIFLGGGTPSLMPPDHLETLLNHITKLWGIDSHTEITLETNPGTVNVETFRQFQRAGVNRISMGVQSFNDNFLSKFGRIHTGLDAKKALNEATLVFDRVSIDLIYGFPEQTQTQWLSDLKILSEYNLKHVSAYALTCEPHTQYAFDIKKGKLKALPAETQGAFQDLTYQYLGDLGFEAYEISNFAKPSEESRHNLAYWHYKPFLGVGAGATSQFIGNNNNLPWVIRRTRHKLPNDYMKAVENNQTIDTFEEIPSSVALFEYLMMNLRLKQGIDLDRLNTFAKGLITPHILEVFNKLSEEGKLLKKEGGYGVTQEGFLLNNTLLTPFFYLLGQES